MNIRMVMYFFVITMGVVMLRFLPLLLLFAVTIFVILYSSWQIQDRIDNLADASCADGRLVYQYGD